MVSKGKLYSQLDRLEDDLRSRIIAHLESAVLGNNDLVFCASDFNPHTELKSRTDKETDELVQLGRQVLALKEKLGEQSEGSIAERLCWYCRKWGDSNDSHRGSAQSLARDFLQEITYANTKT